MRTTLAIGFACVGLAVVACGDDDSSNAAATRTDPATAPARTATTAAAPARAAGRPGTLIVLRSSRFGRVLFDGRGQAIYLFQRERTKTPRCYGECARAWPPVFARGKPRAGRGLDPRLLGTTRRRNGSLQVTYGGHPLYFYANEGRGEILCHNVFLNGGLWKVLNARGRGVR